MLKHTFLHILDVQDVRKLCASVQTRVMGNSNALFKMVESIWTLKDLFIFLIFCVLESIVA